MQSCNACDALSDCCTTNAAGYCEDCLGEVEIDLANDLSEGRITQDEYDRIFNAIHA